MRISWPGARQRARTEPRSRRDARGESLGRPPVNRDSMAGRPCTTCPSARVGEVCRADRAKADFDLGCRHRPAGDVSSFRKLDPRIQVKNPVMFIVEVGSLLTTIVFIQELAGGTGRPFFTGQVAFWLWFTVLFANFAEAMAEGRGKAQADTLRKTRTETVAHRDVRPVWRTSEPAASLRKGDVVMVRAGEFIPADGEIIEGVASVDESAITGEWRMVRESGGDRSAVTGGTRVISDWIKVTRDLRSWSLVLRPHDCARRGRGTPEDPERDRAEYPAGGAHVGLSARRRDASAVRVLRGDGDSDSGADCLARVLDPHHHRRPHFGNWHCRDGSSGSTTCSRCPVGCGGRRRCAHPVTRQDRHDHLG